MQQRFFECHMPRCDWVAPDLGTLPDWPVHGRVAIDLETHDPDLTRLGPGVRRDGRIIGVAFAIEDGPAHYLPIGHVDGNVDRDIALRYLCQQAARFQGTLVGANLSYDLDYLWANGLNFQPKWFRDVTVAEPLLNELEMEYGLDVIAGRHNLPGKDESLLREAAEAIRVNPKKEMHKLPAKYVGGYAEQDVRLPLQILRRQERVIEAEELQQVWDLESRVLPITVRMRQRGVKVNLDKLDVVERWAYNEGTTALKQVYHLTNHKLVMEDLNNSDAIAKPLLDIGVELVKGKNKKYSVDAQLLKSVDHDVARALARAKKMHNVQIKFGNSVRKHIVDGRLHASFNQLRFQREDGTNAGAAYGRMSSSDPNLQQQPARDAEIAKRWRDIYEPDDGMLWAANDYSQQEPRMVVHYAGRLDCYGAKEAIDRYCNDPKADNHTMMAQLLAGEGPDWIPDKKTRDNAKIIFLGLCYGMGGGKLCVSLGLPTERVWSERMQRFIIVAGEEGQALLDTFDRKVPFVKELARKCERVAKQRGYIRTIAGRRCRFPLKPDGTYDWSHKALNRLIQGSSADQTKMAMVAVEAAGHAIQLQVHDEIDLSVRDRKHAEEVAEIMTTCTPLNVPSRVDVEVGPSWGTAA